MKHFIRLFIDGKESKTSNECNSLSLDDCLKDFIFLDVTHWTGEDFDTSYIETEIWYSCSEKEDPEKCVDSVSITLECFMTNEEEATPSKEEVCFLSLFFLSLRAHTDPKKHRFVLSSLP